MKTKPLGMLLMTLALLLICSFALADGPVNPRRRHVMQHPRIIEKSGEETEEKISVPSKMAGVTVVISGPDTVSLSSDPVTYTAAITGDDEKSWVIEWELFCRDGGEDGYGYLVYSLNGTESRTHKTDKILVSGNYILYAYLYDASTYSASSNTSCIAAGSKYFTVTGDSAHETLPQAVTRVANSCRKSTEWATVLEIHDWLTHHLYYDSKKEYYGEDAILRGYGVCDAYSKAFRMLCLEVGISCERVISNEQNHAWNAVRIGPAWYQVDVTWDDPAGSKSATSGYECYDYFCLTTELMKLDHIYDDWSFNVACNSLEANYFIHENLWEKMGLSAVLRDGEYVIVTKAEEIAELIDNGDTNPSLSWDRYIIHGENDTIYYRVMDAADQYRACVYHAYGLDGKSILLPSGDSVKISASFDKNATALRVKLIGWDIYETGTIWTPAETEEILEDAFKGMKATKVILNNACRVIGEGAFASSSLRYIRIPYGIRSIGETAFDGCGRLIFETDSELAKQYAGEHHILVISP